MMKKNINETTNKDDVKKSCTLVVEMDPSSAYNGLIMGNL